MRSTAIEGWLPRNHAPSSLASAENAGIYYTRERLFTRLTAFPILKQSYTVPAMACRLFMVTSFKGGPLRQTKGAHPQDSSPRPRLSRLYGGLNLGIQRFIAGR
jgi:hypothetical protein